MSITYIEEKQVFILETDATCYQFRIAEFGFLEHLYYGKKIKGTGEYLPVRIRHGFECNPYEAEKNRAISLDVLQQEYPGFGVSDFRTPVRHGKIVVDSTRGISSHYQNPSVILCSPGATEESGNCIGMALVYSGDFSITAEVNAFRQTRLTAGINPDTFCWELEPGATFQSPEAVMTFSSSGLETMSRKLHRGIQKHLIRSKFKDIRRPVLINNWEATMIDFDEEILLDIAGKAAELGVELFVLDDGWFDRRTDEYRGLGDWVCNYDKIPSGIDGLAKKIRAMGLKFGLWIEPEMISEDSRLYEEHPDWCIAIPGRNFPSLCVGAVPIDGAADNGISRCSF